MTDLIPVQRPLRAQTLGNCATEYVETQFMGTIVSSRKKVSVFLERLIVYLDKREMSPKAIASYFPYLLNEKQLHPNYVREIAYHIRRFFQWCWTMGYSETRWQDYVPKVRGEAPLDPEIIQHGEYLRLREAARDPEQDWLIVCGYNTGFRLGDCCMLRWSQIDQDRQVISRVINKTRKSTGARSEIPYVSGGDLHQKLIALMADESMPDIGKDYVCPTVATRYFCNQGLIRMNTLKLFCRAGLNGKSFKNLRATFESRLANSGMNIVLAAKITGRSDLKTLLRYVRPDMDAARDGVARALELHHTHKEFA